LRSGGHKVFAVDLYNNERDDYERCDVKNYRQIERMFENYCPFDYVYHLIKTLDFSKAIKDLKHDPKVNPE
jgi:nucleoside-diphosphate-sugar epimerase